MTAGAAAEAAAAAFLQKRGCRLLRQNYFCRFGEIDIIADDGGVLAFVEVRRRQNLAAAAASITAAKRKKLTAAAGHYLAASGHAGDCRFDALLVDGQGAVRWLKNAFGGE